MLDGREESLEIPLAEAPRAAALDHFEEQRRPVLHRLGEDLQQVTLVVAVHQDAQLAQMQAQLETELDAGALGIGMGIQYVPGATREEVFAASVRETRESYAKQVTV